ncbi:hypothetical protein SEPCBS57363_005163 [Sporothrix epigloea]|uniref:Prokaryotic-type class I peptide chain release factors domain-containing protein n=1 Tax=Sporothrix epigloea TaxID=1892477 RepID=A0ABP0DYY7_9PEZI
MAAASPLRPSPTVQPLWLHCAVTVLATPHRAAGSGRYTAFDSGFDTDDLKTARQWRQSFTQDGLPKGNTIYSRSSGPGGQHVNKTETKATTTWAVGELAGMVPLLIRPRLRMSRYYTKANDSFTIHAQEQRSRTANAEANRVKLYEELVALYEASVPGESRPETATKYKAV